jgi:hypothetical protein
MFVCYAAGGGLGTCYCTSWFLVSFSVLVLGFLGRGVPDARTSKPQVLLPWVCCRLNRSKGNCAAAVGAGSYWSGDAMNCVAAGIVGGEAAENAMLGARTRRARVESEGVIVVPCAQRAVLLF